MQSLLHIFFFILMLPTIDAAEAVASAMAVAHYFTAFRSPPPATGDALCATDNATLTLHGVRSKAQCSAECMKHFDQCKHFNYKKSADRKPATCELYACKPSHYTVVDGCLHYQVSLILMQITLSLKRWNFRWRIKWIAPKKVDYLTVNNQSSHVIADAWIDSNVLSGLTTGTMMSCFLCSVLIARFQPQHMICLAVGSLCTYSDSAIYRMGAHHTNSLEYFTLRNIGWPLIMGGTSNTNWKK